MAFLVAHTQQVGMCFVFWGGEKAGRHATGLFWGMKEARGRQLRPHAHSPHPRPQVEDKKAVLAASLQVDDMYDMLSAYEQKVPTADQVRGGVQEEGQLWVLSGRPASTRR